MHPLIGFLLGTALVCLGIYGALVRRNAILVLMALELMLAGITIFFVTADAWLGNKGHQGQVATLFVIALAAAEVGIGLAIVLRLFRQQARQPAAIDLDSVDAGERS